MRIGWRRALDVVEDRVDALEASPGGGADLSAVDQDVVIQNNHQIEFQGDVGSDPATTTAVRWDTDTFYGLVVESNTDNGETDVYVVKPGNPARYARLAATGIGAQLQLQSAAGVAASMTVAWSGVFVGGNYYFDVLHGPILTSPDGSMFMVKVADDGTLSTEPWTAP